MKNIEFDYCITGKVERCEVRFNSPLASEMHGVSYSAEIHFDGGASCTLKGNKKPLRLMHGDIIKVTSFHGEYEIENLSNPPTGDNQPKK